MQVQSGNKNLPSARGKEERKYPRTSLEDTALLMILTGETDVLERATVHDICTCGACFNNVAPVKGFAKDRDQVNPEQKVLVYFENNPITLFGTLKRVDNTSGRVAISVERSTNSELWESLCAPGK